MMSDKLRAAAQAALESTKSLSVWCEDFSHSKKDLHRDDNCPPLQRYNAALTALKDALAEPEEKLLRIHRLDQWLKAALAEQKPMLEMNPQKREWVGLTESEAFLCKKREYFETYKAIEAKLREKNT